ncbi:hypothetical protein GCM10010525_36060 [Glutamicibacter bergerei]|uniref:Uncharacterized protein n=1 Tax=Glutamicibacter ardleyensis TaxID=225894 RepID=A0ABQ2DEA6_9MICC|nr:hypothetical protein GCM10007173_11940 [Glutamicibacter ardleyensis]
MTPTNPVPYPKTVTASKGMSVRAIASPNPSAAVVAKMNRKDLGSFSGVSVRSAGVSFEVMMQLNIL